MVEVAHMYLASDGPLATIDGVHTVVPRSVGESP